MEYSKIQKSLRVAMLKDVNAAVIVTTIKAYENSASNTLVFYNAPQGSYQRTG